MGKATRWLRGLLGLKKEKEKERPDKEKAAPTPSSDPKEKKRWSFSKQPQIPSSAPADATWLRSYLAETEQQQNKHAIAVAAATAAAADAAVAAAQAAVAVARKALRALKGLVKLQALVRGYLVRKQAAATLHSMQALIRAQASVRSQRARRRTSKEKRSHLPRRSNMEEEYEFHSNRLSLENAHNVFDESPKIVEIDTYSRPSSSSRSRSRRIQTFDDPAPPYYYPSVSSPLPCPVLGRLSIPESRQDLEWAYSGECRGAATAQSTPRFANSWRSNIAPPTPARSVCGDGLFRPYSNFPSYMANTQSFCAKLRSQSAPKQRPPEQQLKMSSKKRMSLNEMMASRNSFSGVRMNRSSFDS